MMVQMIVNLLYGFPVCPAPISLVTDLSTDDRAYNYNDPLIRRFCFALLSPLLILMVQQVVSVFSCRPMEILYDGHHWTKLLLQFLNIYLSIFLAFIVGMMVMLSKFVRWRVHRRIVYEIQ